MHEVLKVALTLTYKGELSAFFFGIQPTFHDHQHQEHHDQHHEHDHQHEDHFVSFSIRVLLCHAHMHVESAKNHIFH